MSDSPDPHVLPKPPVRIRQLQDTTESYDERCSSRRYRVHRGSFRVLRRNFPCSSFGTVGVPQLRRPDVLHSRYLCSEITDSKVSHISFWTSGSVSEQCPVSVVSLGEYPVTTHLYTSISRWFRSGRVTDPLDDPGGNSGDLISRWLWYITGGSF